MRVVLAHDSFTQLGGAERVVLRLAELFPDSPIFTLAADRKILDQLPESVSRRIQPSVLQWLYRLYPRFQHLLPLIPLAIWLTRIPKCDILLSSSSAFAKSFRKPRRTQSSLRGASPRATWQSRSSEFTEFRLPRSQGLPRNDRMAVHINYCHTPTRFLWSDSEYVGQEVPWMLRGLARLFLRWLRRWDLRAASRVDKFIANSKEVQSRIKKFYGQDSEVVYPFVDTTAWEPDRAKGIGLRAKSELVSDDMLSPDTASVRRSFDERGARSPDAYFLIAGRLHAHKHNDIVVEVCSELGLPLRVVGRGRDETRLQSLAGPTVEFLGYVSDEELKKQFAGALAYIYPQLEDFGLMPLEAAACGTPTIAADQGGSRETVVPGVTGEWFRLGDRTDLRRILLAWDTSRYNVAALRRHAELFNRQKFDEAIMRVVAIKS